MVIDTKDTPPPKKNHLLTCMFTAKHMNLPDVAECKNIGIGWKHVITIE